MGQVYSELFASYHQEGDGSTLGPDASHRWVIRDIELFTPNLTSYNVQLVMSTGATFFQFEGTTGAGGQWNAFHDYRVVVLEGTYFTILNGSNNSDITISGYNLVLP